ncbi:unnamed protein product [Prunus brigantina]
MKRTRRGTTEASSSRPKKECLIASVKGHRALRLAPQKDQPQHGPANNSEDTTEVEDVAAIHNTNVEEREPLSACRRHLPFVSGIGGLNQ